MAAVTVSAADVRRGVGDGGAADQLRFEQGVLTQIVLGHALFDVWLALHTVVVPYLRRPAEDELIAEEATALLVRADAGD